MNVAHDQIADDMERYGHVAAWRAEAGWKGIEGVTGGQWWVVRYQHGPTGLQSDRIAGPFATKDEADASLPIA